MYLTSLICLIYCSFFKSHVFLYYFIPKIEIINCKTIGLISVYIFVPVMAKKNIKAENISFFENLNIIQLRLEKNALK